MGEELTSRHGVVGAWFPGFEDSGASEEEGEWGFGSRCACRSVGWWFHLFPRWDIFGIGREYDDLLACFPTSA